MGDDVEFVGLNLALERPPLPLSVGEVEAGVGVPVEETKLPPLKVLGPGPPCTAEGASMDVLSELEDEEGEGPAGEWVVGVEGPEEGGKGKLLFAAACEAIVLEICASLAGGMGTGPFLGRGGGVTPAEFEAVPTPLLGT